MTFCWNSQLPLLTGCVPNETVTGQLTVQAVFTLSVKLNGLPSSNISFVTITARAVEDMARSNFLFNSYQNSITQLTVKLAAVYS